MSRRMAAARLLRLEARALQAAGAPCPGRALHIVGGSAEALRLPAGETHQTEPHGAPGGLPECLELTKRGLRALSGEEGPLETRESGVLVCDAQTRTRTRSSVLRF